MAEDQVDHLALAEEAARRSDLAVRCSEQGRRDEAVAAAEEAVRLYRTLAEDFPAMFGTEAERAAALATAIREGRPLVSTVAPAAPRPREPEVETATAGISEPGTAGAPDEPGAVTAGPEQPVAPAPAEARPGRSRRRRVVPAMVVSAAAVAVLLGAVGAAGWVLSRPQMPAPAPVQSPPPAAAPARAWTATARIDVAPTGVTLRSAPSTTGAPVGRLSPGAEVPIRCGEIGRMTSSEVGEQSSSWLRTTAGAYLAAVNVEFQGPSPVPNCVPGRPPVPVPHHR